MSGQTPIQNLSRGLIRADCQRRAFNRIAQHTQGVRDLTRMKAALGGTLGPDVASLANRTCDDE